MALVSRTRSTRRADEIVPLDNVNKFIDVSINNLAMFSKKAILEASVYLLGDEEDDIWSKSRCRRAADEFPVPVTVSRRHTHAQCEHASKRVLVLVL